MFIGSRGKRHGGEQRVRGRARRGRAGVREHAGGLPGLPKSVSGRSVGGTDFGVWGHGIPRLKPSGKESLYKSR